MEKKMKNLTILIIFLFSINLFAQDVIVDLDDNGDIILFNSRVNKQPLIELAYSFPKITHQDFQNTNLIKNIGDFQLRLGYTYTSDSKIRKIYEEYLLVGYSSPSFALSPNGAYQSFETWKVGSISRVSYALSLSSNVDFVPYYSGGLFFYSMSFKDGGTHLFNSSNDKTIISRTADGKVHFGNMFESGIRFKLNNSFSLFGGYSGNMFYPRFMTWKFLGSLVTYQIGLTLIENFDSYILRRSNVAGAIVDVILKSAYNYMFFYFQKGDMNWPVNTETPFVHEGPVVGVSFNF